MENTENNEHNRIEIAEYQEGFFYMPRGTGGIFIGGWRAVFCACRVLV
jgi:hypothetical protein